MTFKELPVPECIHDREHKFFQEYKIATKTTEVRCDDCGTILYTRTIDLMTMKSTTEIEDEVYETLYTSKGRLKLVTEYLNELNWPIPELWPVGEE